MGLFDINGPGGLFGGIYKERPGYQTPGIGDGINPDTQDAINTYAAMPKGKQGKGGVFGSGYDGEDIMSMLLRAAAIAQGDYASGAAFGENIGARARKAAEEAAKRQQERDDYVWKKETDQRFAGPKELPTSIQEAQWLNDPARTPEELRAYYQAKGPTLVVSNGNTQAYNRDGTPYGSVAPTAPVGKLTPLSEGGGVSDGTSGFRVNVPRIRP